MADRTQHPSEKQPLSRKKKILLILVILVVIAIIFFGYRGYKKWTATPEDTGDVTTTAVMKEGKTPTPHKQSEKVSERTTVREPEKTRDAEYDVRDSTQRSDFLSSDRTEAVTKQVIKIAFVLPLSSKTPEYAQYVKRQVLSVDVPSDTRFEYQIYVEDGGKTTDTATAKASEMIKEYSVDAVVVLRPAAASVAKMTQPQGVIPVSITYVQDRFMNAAERRLVKDPVTLLVDVFEKLAAKSGKKPTKSQISDALKSYKNALQAGLPSE